MAERNQSRVVERVEIGGESGTYVLENCVVFRWEGHEHFSGDDKCPGCYVSALVCRKDGGLLHSEDVHMDDAGDVWVATQCDKELPDDPLAYGVSNPGSIPLRVPTNGQPTPDQLMTSAARVARPKSDN